MHNGARKGVNRDCRYQFYPLLSRLSVTRSSYRDKVERCVPIHDKPRQLRLNEARRNNVGLRHVKDGIARAVVVD